MYTRRRACTHAAARVHTPPRVYARSLCTHAACVHTQFVYICPVAPRSVLEMGKTGERATLVYTGGSGAGNPTTPPELEPADQASSDLGFKCTLIPFPWGCRWRIALKRASMPAMLEEWSLKSKQNPKLFEFRARGHLEMGSIEPLVSPPRLGPLLRAALCPRQ